MAGLADSADAAGADLRLSYAPVFQPLWDATPAAYVEAGVVSWGRSRRLLRADDARFNMKAYIGVQHSDPARWGLAGEPDARYFLSVLLGKRTLFLRTHSTFAAALRDLRETQARLSEHEV